MFTMIMGRKLQVTSAAPNRSKNARFAVLPLTLIATSVAVNTLTILASSHAG